MTRLLPAAGVLVISVATAGAQSLGEAARRAEDARKANASTALTFDARDVDPMLARQELLGVELDAEAWRRFLPADRAVAAALKQDPAALQRFRSLEVSSIRAMERFLQKEPAVANAIAASGTDLHDYASTHLAVVLATRERSVSSLDAELLPRAIKSNIAFITTRDREVNGLAAPPAKLALRILPPAPRVASGTPVPRKPAAAPAPASSSTPDVAVTAPSADGPIDMQPGAGVPDFDFLDLNGSTRSLSDFRGKYVLLDFWGSWCGPCLAEVPYAKDAYERFRSRGFEILALDYEPNASVEDIRAFVRDAGITYTFARADSVRSLITERFRVRSFPTLILLDPDRRIVQVPRGGLRGATLAKTLDAVLPK
jgi:thiol-disulfide isomerase/thioredoxin